MKKDKVGCFFSTIKLLFWLGLFVGTIILVEKYQSLPFLSYLRTISKLLSYYIVFLFIPSIIYLRKTNFIKIWTISLAVLIFFLAYKWWVALLVLNFAIFNHFQQAFKKSSSELKKEKPNWSFLFLPTIVASIIVFVITRELIWINGLSVLFAWFISSRIQDSYIAPIFNLTRNYTSEKDSDIKRDKDFTSFIVLLVAFSIFFIFAKIEQTPAEFFSSILNGILKGSLAIIGLLIALQSLLNRGYNSESTRERFFEARLNIQSIKAIKGIILLFMLLIVMLLIGYLIKPLFVDFTFPTLLWFSKNDLSIPLLQRVITVIFLSTILGTTLLSLYQLHFLFLSGNLVTLPHRIFLNNTPLVFEKEFGYGVDENIKDKIKSSIGWSREVNGEVIKEFGCVVDSETNKIIVTVWFEILVPEKEDLLDKTMHIARSVFYHKEVGRINVLAKSMVSNLGLTKIYSSELDRDSYEKIDKGKWLKLSFDSKVELIKPFFTSYAFKESDYF